MALRIPTLTEADQETAERFADFCRGCAEDGNPVDADSAWPLWCLWAVIDMDLPDLATMPYAEYLATPEWAQKRAAALERAGRRCQVCSGTLRLEVHHRTYERRGEESPEDLTVLCRGCHALFHGVPR